MRDILVRASKTFVQTFLGAYPVSALMGLDISTLESATLAAAAATLSVFWNAALNWARSP